MQGSKAHIRAQHQEEPCGPEEQHLFFLNGLQYRSFVELESWGVWEAIHWLKIKNKFKKGGKKKYFQVFRSVSHGEGEPRVSRDGFRPNPYITLGNNSTVIPAQGCPGEWIPKKLKAQPAGDGNKPESITQRAGPTCGSASTSLAKPLYLFSLLLQPLTSLPASGPFIYSASPNRPVGLFRWRGRCCPNPDKKKSLCSVRAISRHQPQRPARNFN